MTLPRTADVLVVGGGVVGCAIARELAATRRVVLVDRGAIGGGASTAAAGVLAVASGDDEGDRLALRRASRAGFPQLAAALHDETGVEVGFDACGVLAVARTGDELAALGARAAARTAAGLRAERLDAAASRAAEPLVRDDAAGGVFFPDDAVVVAQKLVEALAEAARRRGAAVVAGAPALAVERAGGRVLRVRVGEGWVSPGAVVVATGAWGGGAVADLDLGIGIVPVRGQMIALRAPRVPRCVLTAGEAFVVPRPNGEAWVGATFEHAGFDARVTADGLARLASHLGAVAPALRAAPVVRAWSGLRPSCPAGGPVVGRPPGLANVVVALGHHRNGILLAPLTADAVRAWLDGAPVPDAVRPFAPA